MAAPKEFPLLDLTEPAAASVWTPARVRRLAALVRAGRSASEAARTLGTTRGDVLRLSSSGFGCRQRRRLWLLRPPEPGFGLRTLF